ncbi:uncharacterized protein LOC144744491 [Ciona intestinalis]
MTKKGDNELRIDITTCDYTKIVANYSTFVVGPESDRYRLNITGYQHQQGIGCDYRNSSVRWSCGRIGIPQEECMEKTGNKVDRNLVAMMLLRIVMKSSASIRQV